MWTKFSLRSRVYVILAALVCITLLGGLTLVWYTYQMENLLSAITQQGLKKAWTAQSLENALANQKGYVSYYFIDGDPEWLRQLAVYRRQFQDTVESVRTMTLSEEGRGIIEAIASEYGQYIKKKDRVIELYKSGERQAGQRLHADVRRHFSALMQLCEDFKATQLAHIDTATAEAHSEARRLRLVAVTAMSVGFLLVASLGFISAYQIWRPLRRLAAEAERKPAMPKAGNELQALSTSVRGLIQDVDQTHSALERSRESLLHAEKLALVGKLAAGMAHSIRNPFTSVKMRLFSLGRTLQLTEPQKEDFDVISEEIRHVDTIVQNFLEFSRPPKLRMEIVSPSTIIDQTLQLLVHRLKSYDVDVTVERTQPLPKIALDPEQLKEVFVNLLINACEAMEKGGSIRITELQTADASGRPGVGIRIADTGPGIPPEIRDKVLQPFFTTKDNGTGLGLSIAERIVSEHQGCIAVESRPGAGAVFTIILPNQEPHDEHHTDR